MRKTFRYRLFPTPAQQRKMLQTLRECRGLYNTLLAERRDTYERTGKSPSLYSQQGGFRKTAAGKWFVCVSCEVEPKALPESSGAVGVDVGLKDIITTSDGEGVSAPKFFRKEERELARTQRRLSEAPKGSRERAKRRKIVAKVHERIKNRRMNFAHQQSRKLVNRYGFVAVEDLSVNRMNKNRCLAKSIADAAWTDLTEKLSYKAEWAGREFVKVSPAYTTQDCSRCSHRQVMPLDKRVYDCPNCGLSLNRDTNAARNIKRLGLESLGVA
jgi:putative transposase